MARDCLKILFYWITLVPYCLWHNPGTVGVKSRNVVVNQRIRTWQVVKTGDFTTVTLSFRNKVQREMRGMGKMVVNRVNVGAKHLTLWRIREIQGLNQGVNYLEVIRLYMQKRSSLRLE